MHSKIISFLLLLFLCRPFPAGAQEAAATQAGEFLTWKYDFGMDERIRYEYKHDFDFNKNSKDNGGVLYNRLKVHASATLSDEYLNKIVEIFIEGLDGETGAFHMKAPTNQRDKFDLHQAYVNFLDIADSHFNLKLGRQEIQYGAGRLVAAPTWANLIRSFDAAIVRYENNGFRGDILYGQNVQFHIYSFDDSYPTENLSGVYLSYQKYKVSPLFEGYFLYLDNTRAKNDVHRYTTGLRFKSIIAPGTVVDIEIPYQFGKDGGKTVSAYALHADISKSIDALVWKPKLAFSYDQASGNKKSRSDRTNTFIPLYQSTHAPYGLMDFFRWENMRNPEFSVTFYPTDKFRFQPQVDFFWLDSTNDSWYNSSGTALRNKRATGKCSHYVGSEASIRFYYDFTKNIKLEMGYAHFFPGEYVKNTGTSNSADWAYTQFSFKY